MILPNIDEIIKELDLSKYISEPLQKQMEEKCRKVIDTQYESEANITKQIDPALDFIKTLWDKYDCEVIENIYMEFVKMEEALYGLERNEEQGQRYRDHFLHMFNCFVFGIRLISKIIKELGDTESKKTFKIDDESVDLFGHKYNCCQRLFYLWILISTLHDIAIPIQHLTNIGKGINSFIKEFGLNFSDSCVTMKDFDSSQLYHYFELLSSIYGGELELELDRKQKKYKKAANHYVCKLLGREFDNKNHGVISGFFLWKTIEEIFLLGRAKNHTFDISQFNTYVEYFLEQDIARAALAISLHGIKEDSESKKLSSLFPVKFEKYPLTFILILADELQEYLRWEGKSIAKQMNFTCHPEIIVKKDESNILVTVSFSVDSKNKHNIIEHAKQIDKTNKEISTIDAAISIIGNEIKEKLEKKLHLGYSFGLKLEIFEDVNRQLFCNVCKTNNGR